MLMLSVLPLSAFLPPLLPSLPPSLPLLPRCWLRVRSSRRRSVCYDRGHSFWLAVSLWFCFSFCFSFCCLGSASTRSQMAGVSSSASRAEGGGEEEGCRGRKVQLQSTLSATSHVCALNQQPHGAPSATVAGGCAGCGVAVCVRDSGEATAATRGSATS